jgi:hypothetical protein
VLIASGGCTNPVSSPAPKPDETYTIHTVDTEQGLITIKNSDGSAVVVTPDDTYNCPASAAFSEQDGVYTIGDITITVAADNSITVITLDGTYNYTLKHNRLVR